MFTRWVYSKPGKVTAALLVMFLGFVYLNNTSLLAEPPGDRPLLLAHRAVGQPYDRTGLTNETCTAAKMIPVDHDYLENTIPSMAAAFAYGADIVEFDVKKRRATLLNFAKTLNKNGCPPPLQAAAGRCLKYWPTCERVMMFGHTPFLRCWRWSSLFCRNFTRKRG